MNAEMDAVLKKCLYFLLGVYPRDALRYLRVNREVLDESLSLTNKHWGEIESTLLSGKTRNEIRIEIFAILGIDAVNADTVYAEWKLGGKR